MGDRDGQGTRFTREHEAVVAHSAVNPFCAIDQTGSVVWAGSSISEVLGIEAEALVGRSMLDFVAPESLDHAIQSLAAAGDYLAERAGSPTWEGHGPVLRLRRPDGDTVSCAIAAATPIRTGLPSFVLQIRRADAAHALESALVAMGRGRPLPEVLGHVAEMLEGDLPSAEVALFRRYGAGAPLEQIVGPAGLTGILDESLAGTPWELAASKPGEITERPVEELPDPWRDAASSRGFRWLSVLTVPATDDGPPIAAVLVWSRHPYPMHVFTHERVQRCGSLVALVVQWERGQRALLWAATHDVLTRLHNRSHFMDQLERQAANGDPHTTAVLYLDLDDFKPVNDVHGHDIGDLVLVEVARRLRASIRPGDIVARLGGDEFAVLCRDVDDLEVAERLASRLVDEVSEPIDVEGLHVLIGLTVGIARLLPGEDMDTVLARADAALRAAKSDGKRRWRIAGPMPADR